jgi:hypothetical protein
MARPQRDTRADGAQQPSARGREARGTWHARTVTTTPDLSPAAAVAADRGGPGVDTVRRVLDRLGVHTVLGRDVVLAGVWALVTIAFLATLLAAGEFYGANRSIPTTQVVAVIVLALVQHVPLALRRVRPVTALLAVAVLQAALLAVLPTGLALWTAAPVVTAYTVATLRPTRVVVGVVLAAVGIEAVGAAVGASALVKDQLGAPAGLGEVGVVVEALALVASAVLIDGVSAAVGSWVALRRAHDRDARARAAESVEHQATLTRAAVAAERTRGHGAPAWPVNCTTWPRTTSPGSWCRPVPPNASSTATPSARRSPCAASAPRAARPSTRCGRSWGSSVRPATDRAAPCRCPASGTWATSSTRPAPPGPSSTRTSTARCRRWPRSPT